MVFNGASQTISGSTTFYNLTDTTGGATLTFQAGTTQAVTNTLALQGSAGNLLAIRSTIAGIKANISAPSSRTAGYLNIQDSYISVATAAGSMSTDSGNNTNWVFGTPAFTWIAATPGNWSSAANWQGGVAPGTGNVAVFRGDVSNQPCTIDTQVNVAGVSITTSYSSTLTQGASTVTIGSSGWTQAGGTFTGYATDATHNISVSGPFTLNGGTFTSTAGTLQVSGNWAQTGGSFVHNSGTVNFTAASPGAQTLWASSAFNNLTHSGSGTLNAGGGIPCFSDWYYYKSISIASSMVSSANAPYANFPVLIQIADDHNLAAHARQDGNDLVFTDANGNLLPYEVENYSYNGGATGGAIGNIWVQIPSLSATVDTTLYMLYGNSSCATSNQNAAGVWDSDYSGVYHLDNPSSPYDSTVNGNNGTNNGCATAIGQIGGGAGFDGISSYISLPSGTLDWTNNFTISAWVCMSNESLYDNTILGCSPDGVQYNLFSFSQQKGSIFLYEAYNCGYDGFGDVWGTTTPALNQWYHVALVNNSTSYIIYVNGNQDGSGTIDSSCVQPTGANIGSLGPTYLTDYFMNGVIDEVNLSNTARSAGWIATGYNNQSNPGNFESFGAEVAGNGNLTVQGNLTLTSGAFTAPAAINIAGNWTNNGGTFTPGTGTGEFRRHSGSGD